MLRSLSTLGLRVSCLFCYTRAKLESSEPIARCSLWSSMSSVRDFSQGTYTSSSWCGGGWWWLTLRSFSSVAALIYVLLVSPICLSHLPARLLSHHTAVHHKTQLFPLPSPRILNDKMYASFLAYTMSCLSKFSVYANSFLAMMNARGSLRDTISQPIDVEFNLGTSLRFDCSASTVGCTSPEGRKNSQSHVSDDV